jgi:uncharacterized phage protein gp47/JayE
MPYFPPTLGPSGLEIPTYQEIEDYLVAEAKRIYGEIYLENDSQDFQLIASYALTAYETMLLAQQVYNARSPVTAISSGLDGVVSVNGLQRNPVSFSTAPLTITGTDFTLIQNGIVTDTAGFKWALPASVTIGDSGSVTVTGTCLTPGPVAAGPGTITQITTPVFGWTGVTNAFAATLGRAQESDTQLRYRQAVSVANPSQALKTGILGAILDIPNVIAAQVYENDTNASVTSINGVSNPDGFPAHSLTAVVNGGDGLTIAQVIDLRKTPGCYSNGDQVFIVPDSNGVNSTIRFFRPQTRVIDVVVTLDALAGYNSSIGTLIQQAITSYLNSLTIGQSVIRSEVERAALSVNNGLQYPLFSLDTLTIAVTGNAQGTANLPMTFKQQPVSGSVSITVNP